MNKRLINFVPLVLLIAVSLSAGVFPDRNGFDRYGGYLAIKGEATGRFHLQVIEDRHFLVTPDGHGFLSVGVTHTGGLSRPDQSKHDHLRQNLDNDWGKANTELVSHFRKWGYNSLGYDSHPSTRKLLPHFASCYPTSKVSSWQGKQIRFPDVFSDGWKQSARNELEQMAKRFPDHPNRIGIYWTDMPAWDLKQAKRVAGKTWVDAIRELPDDAPGKRRYERFLRENGANVSDQDFLVLIAREVYSHIGPLTRKLAPNTLVFGERYSGTAMPWRVIQEALPWIDVLSVQPSGSLFSETDFDRAYRETKKPVIICDHQVSFTTPEHSNVMWKTLPDIASVGEAHARYLQDGFSTRYLIGYKRCQYIDRYNGELKILKQGLLQVDGTPYEELAATVLRNNWRLHQRFLGAQEERK